MIDQMNHNGAENTTLETNDPENNTMESNTRPFFSIIVPCYNAEQYIEETIASAQRQTFKNFEIIVVNDGSTDQSANILQRLSEQLPCLKVYSQPNKGLPGARNTALEYATGQWIVLLDADDKFTPDRLATLADLIDRYPTSKFFFHDAFRMDAQGRQENTTYLQRGSFYTDLEKFAVEKNNGELVLDANVWQFMLCKYTWLLPITICIDATTVKSIGTPFDERLIVGEDVDFCIRCLMLLDHCIYANKPLAYYRLHGNSITHDENYTCKRSIYFKIMYEKFYTSLDTSYRRHYVEKYAEHCFNLSYLYRKRGLPGKALRSACQGFIMRPSTKRLPHLLKSVLPASKEAISIDSLKESSSSDCR